MEKIRVELGERSYAIIVDENVLKDLGKTLSKFEFSPKTAVISNHTIFDIYGDAVCSSLREAGFEVSEVIIPDGEEYKTTGTMQDIWGGLLKAKLDRKSTIVALGGGVIGDMAGFAASTYMRGIDFIQVPTTLLAQVDSSVGGKTGVNHELGKNMIGTFWQPRLVMIDIKTLSTLPGREFVSGMAEVIKYGVIWDEEFFRYLEDNREKILALDPVCIKHIIRRSCEIKADVVSRDEREGGIRAILNYGHTIGHAVETVTGYTEWLHGEAVAIGMYVEAALARVLGVLDDASVERIKKLITSYGLPAEMPTSAGGFSSMLESMLLDKKTVSGAITFILPERIGSVRIAKGVSPDDIRKACP